ncbi:MAG: type I glyceraldehyde-3-phosphate dehydrogenase [Candidatus Thorarchaeota archaeon]
MTIKLAINGFGRIGRMTFRAGLESILSGDIEVVAVNDLMEPKTLAHLLKYDSTHGILPETVLVDGNKVIIEEKGMLRTKQKEFQVFAEKDPSKLPWGELEVDYVIESTGIFRTKEKASAHLKAGARRVIISAPAPDPNITIVLGVNEEDYDPAAHSIISNASCTTNCLAPVAKILLDNFGIQKGLMTTIHAYTNDQSTLDFPHKDLRRARTAAASMIPTTTGAAKALALVLPQLKGKMNGLAIRIPTENVSLVDLTVLTEKSATVEQINNGFQSAASEKLKGILDYTEEPLVSVDFNGDRHSAIVDGLSTQIVDKDYVKVLAWYDNEMGYAARLIDLVQYMESKE